jgi:hypothetical protein
MSSRNQWKPRSDQSLTKHQNISKRLQIKEPDIIIIIVIHCYCASIMFTYAWSIMKLSWLLCSPWSHKSLSFSGALQPWDSNLLWCLPELPEIHGAITIRIKDLAPSISFQTCLVASSGTNNRFHVAIVHILI